MINAAVAIDRLGPEFRFSTRLYSSQRPNSTGLLEGDLLVFAGGDPSAETKRVDSLRMTWTDHIAAGLYAKGLREIAGNIILSTRPYRLECAPSAWEIGDVKESFAPAVDGFGFNNNVCRLSIFPGESVAEPAIVTLDPPWSPVEIASSITTGKPGSDNWADYYITPCRNNFAISGNVALDDDGEFIWIPVQDPALYYGEALRRSLIKQGIKVIGKVQVARPGFSEKSYGAPYYVHRSAPLSSTLSLMCKDSDNYSAEYVLRQLGISRTGSGTADAGLRAMNRFLIKYQIDRNQIRFVDGCGLARRNLCSARALVDILGAMHRHKHAEAFKYILSHSGIDGTLDYRMGGRLSGRVRAKTGTMTYISTISGYLTLANGDDITFAILCNNFRTSRHHVRGIQDQIIERVYQEFNQK
jgi:PBP4 family serine-type D-alanyl-D-alanine carboxypeptidase